MLTGFFATTPARYLLVGGLCAILNNIILIAGDAAGLHYSASVLLTFVLVLPLSYLAHALWSFTVPASWRAFAHYAAASLSGLAVAAMTVGLLREGLQLPMIAAAPLATLAMTLYNYLATRWAVHR